jgi:hypothetical protein
MTPSQPTDDRIRSHHSCWLITSNAAGRDIALDPTPRAAPILSSAVALPTAQWRLPLTHLAEQWFGLRRPTLLLFQVVAKSP